MTILHLSDLQFGKNHRFAGVDLTGLPNPYDTLLARLWEDLQRLRNDHGLQPDLLIATGDLAEWGMPDEFRDAREFLEKLTDKDHLNLPRQRVAIIPGIRALSPLMAEFFCDLLGKDLAEKRARNELASSLITRTTVKANALEVLKRLGVEAVLNLAGQDLRGKDFAGQSLVGADLTGADLTEARLVGQDLTGAKLDRAKLIHADLTKAILTNVSLEQADLAGARLLGAQFAGARFAGAGLRRIRLTGAQRFALRPADSDLLLCAARGHAAVAIPERCFTV